MDTEQTSDTPTPTIADVKEGAELVSVFGLPFVAAGITLAWFCGPLLRFTSPGWLAFCGFVIAWMLAAIIFTLVVGTGEKKDRDAVNGVAVISAVMLICLLWTLVDARNSASRLDEQCKLLQADMLSLKPLRKDSRELYSALGCRVQAVGTLKFPRKFPTP